MNDEMMMDVSGESSDSSAASAKTTKKKTSKKAASKKKTTKKAADSKTSKKTSKKKTAKKTASKKTTKKAATKKTSKKKASKKKAAKKTSKKTAGEPVEEPGEEQAELSQAEGAGDDQVEDEAEGDESEEDKPSSRNRSSKKSGKKTSKKSGSSRSTSSRSSSSRSSSSRSSSRGRSQAIQTGAGSGSGTDTSDGKKPFTRLAVNYVPGEECRVALTEDGLLQEYEAERFDAISRVGNIYLGRVKNIETGIQAAFVDFGVEEAGFLHVSDLHPSLFPGEGGETTERVGKKTPRRERPPIEKALKRGQQILVQVLKDGVGTKGPALTSYLSIPGRFLVMMPQMDKVGVSRKVDDDDTRKAMRKTLDQLDLPEGFGFILRTAGLGRTKAELKRDLAYLQRLWKDLERKKKGNAPRLLYSESDLLVRTLRDQITGDVDEVVIDSDRALQRAAEFMKIVAPKGAAKVNRYTGQAPLFGALGVEEQIERMHAREVPLPSGGRLVIDQTEALVAIDVNSGRMRSRDNDTNAVRCNLEAADEICRQLRLRDLGGLVINDLIDMRHARHRKEVEQRFADNLRRDKSKSTILPISEFGIMEMTRQRQSASHESKHFTECPTCSGRGLVQRPSSVADDALRTVEAALAFDKVHEAELVVSSRVAGELLSSRRLGLGRVERSTGKHVAVRVSDALRIDQVRVYTYDQNGSDVDLDRMGRGPKPEQFIKNWEPEGAEDWAADIEDEREELLAEAVEAPEIQKIETPGLEDKPDEGGKKKRRRRGRRRGRGGDGDQAESQSENQTESQSEDQTETGDQSDQQDASPGDQPGNKSEADSEGSGEGGKKKRRRRRRRRKSDGERSESNDQPGEQADEKSAQDSDGNSSTDSSDEGSGDDSGDSPGDGKKKRRRRGRRGGSGRGDGDRSTYTGKGGRTAEERGEADGKPEGKPEKKSEPKPDAGSDSKPEVTVKKPRSLYRGSRRKLAPSEIPQVGMED